MTEDELEDLLIDIWHDIIFLPLDIVKNKTKCIRVFMLPIFIPWSIFAVISTIPIPLILLIIMIIKIT